MGVEEAALSGAVLGAVLGALAGVGTRRLLARLRRGTVLDRPVCEVGIAAVWATVGAAGMSGAVPGGWVPCLVGLGWLGVAAGVVDVRRHRLPDALTLPAVPAAVLLVVPLGAAAVGRAGLGALLAVAAYGAVHLAAPDALGAGDVKLAASLGAVLAAGSWAGLALGAVVASVLTLGLALLAPGLRRRWPRARRAPPAPGHGPRPGRLQRGAAAVAVPHGPGMLLGTWLVVLSTAVAAAVG